MTLGFSIASLLGNVAYGLEICFMRSLPLHFILPKPFFKKLDKMVGQANVAEEAAQGDLDPAAFLMIWLHGLRFLGVVAFFNSL